MSKFWRMNSNKKRKERLIIKWKMGGKWKMGVTPDVFILFHNNELIVYFLFLVMGVPFVICEGNTL